MIEVSKVAEIGDAYKTGLSINKLAKIYRVSPNSIVRTLEDLGIPRRVFPKTRINRHILPIEQVAKLYEEGYSAVELGKMYGVSSSCIRYNLIGRVQLRSKREARFLPRASEAHRESVKLLVGRPSPRKGTGKVSKHDTYLRIRKWKLQKHFGLTMEDVQSLIDAQGGKCPICLVILTQDIKICVDHDHRTNEVRGVLCGPCNSGLGFFKDSPERLNRASNYIKKFET